MNLQHNGLVCIGLSAVICVSDQKNNRKWKKKKEILEAIVTRASMWVWFLDKCECWFVLKIWWCWMGDKKKNPVCVSNRCFSFFTWSSFILVVFSLIFYLFYFLYFEVCVIIEFNSFAAFHLIRSLSLVRWFSFITVTLIFFFLFFF